MLTKIAHRLRPRLAPFSTLFVTLLAYGCGGGPDDPQERIQSLRTFGTSSVPVVATVSSAPAALNTALVTLFAAVPLGATASLAPFEDAGTASGAIKLPAEAIALVAGSEHYEDHSSFRVFSAQAHVTVPTADAFGATADAFKGGQVRYGLTITSGDEHEDVVANLDVFPSGAPETAWQNPTATIAAPLSGATVSSGQDVDLKVDSASLADDSIKLGWFVASGSVSNRRAPETKWKPDGGGPQSIALVVHDTRSRGFTLQVIDVTGN